MINSKTLLLLFLLLPKLSLSQNLIYINSSGKTCIKNEAVFYRTITPFKKLYKFENYYISGKIQMVGFSVTKDSLFKVGKFTYLKEDGTNDTIVNYKNNIENGEYKLFYPANAIKEIGTYKNGLLTGENFQYFENGKIKRISYFKKGKYNGKMIYFNKNGIKIGEGQAKEDTWIGKWEKYDDNGVFLTNLFYSDRFKFKEGRLKIETPNHIWMYYPREEEDSNYNYFCRLTNIKNTPKIYLNDSPEIYITIPKQGENFSINNLKIDDKDKYDYILNIKDSKINIYNTFLTKSNSDNNKEYSKIYIELLIENQIVLIKIKVLSEKLNDYESAIKEFITNMKSY